MKSIGWLKFRYICKHGLLCITYIYKAIYLVFPKYLDKSIIIQSYNISSWKWHVMKFVQCSTSLAYFVSALSVIALKSRISLSYDINCITSLALF